ncbi:MAG: hypothetical protein S4CHLAM2_17030 [Chlamydiales bacterium]|nr:hypothetical protein [Chlamydiales bacterium]
MRAFNYTLFRQLAAKAAEGQSLSVIVPYGFELLDSSYPRWPKRHYPLIGYPSHLSRYAALKSGEQFLVDLIERIRSQYPFLYERLRYCEIHRGKLVHFEALGIHSLHVELFPLDALNKTIVDHYARYVIALLGAIQENNHALPQIREFQQFKIRRNRLFQEYVMSESVIKQLHAHFPNRSKNEEALFEELFKQLRVEYPAEVMRGIPFERLAPTEIEWTIYHDLIFNRMRRIRACLVEQAKQKGNEPIWVTSPTYYDDGSHAIGTFIGRADAQKARAFIRSPFKLNKSKNKRLLPNRLV